MGISIDFQNKCVFMSIQLWKQNIWLSDLHLFQKMFPDTLAYDQKFFPN